MMSSEIDTVSSCISDDDDNHNNMALVIRFSRREILFHRRRLSLWKTSLTRSVRASCYLATGEDS